MIQLLASFPTPLLDYCLGRGGVSDPGLESGRPQSEQKALLAEIYADAKRSIGVPVALDSAAIAMFHLVLE